MNEELREILSKLKATRRYDRLVSRFDSSIGQSNSFIFEVLFADTFESETIQLKYEANVNPANQSSIDFLHATERERFCFELVSPEMSDEVYKEYHKPKVEEGVTRYGIALSSHDPRPHHRPEAQTIRMQEKLLEKVYKFPDPENRLFAILVIDCRNFHFGHFDDEDCRMVMIGKTRNPACQEYWEKKPVKGLLEVSYAQAFREKITAVIFIPNLSQHPLSVDRSDKGFQPLARGAQATLSLGDCGLLTRLLQSTDNFKKLSIWAKWR